MDRWYSLILDRLGFEPAGLHHWEATVKLQRSMPVMEDSGTSMLATLSASRLP